MKVILLEDVKGKGKKDDIVELAAGYAMHLIRDKKAVEASKGGVKILDNQKKVKEEEAKKLKNIALKNKDILEKAKIVFQLKVGEGGKVFKSVSHKQIIDKVLKDFEIKLDKRKFKSKETINTLGITKVDVELYKGVIATLNITTKEQ